MEDNHELRQSGLTGDGTSEIVRPPVKQDGFNYNTHFKHLDLKTGVQALSQKNSNTVTFHRICYINEATTFIHCFQALTTYLDNTITKCNK